MPDSDYYRKAAKDKNEPQLAKFADFIDTQETLKILQTQVSQRTTGKLYSAKDRNRKALFISLAKPYRAGEDVDWDYVYQNWNHKPFYKEAK